jgi:hypothetical protein
MRQCFFLALFLSLIASAPARAVDTVLLPLQFSGVYTFHWNAIPFGEMSVTVNQRENGYRIDAHIRSTGVLRLFAPHESYNTVEGGAGPFAETRRTYETHYTTKKKPRHVRLVYSPGGIITEELVEPPEDRSERPVVSAEQKAGSLDPLTYILAVRQSVYDAVTKRQNGFALPVFDGRRLMNTTYRLTETKNIMGWKGGEIPAIGMLAKRDPIAGYTKKELGELATGEPDLNVYFSDDALLVPVKLRVDLWFGSLQADLTRRCEVSAPCTVGKEFSGDK